VQFVLNMQVMFEPVMLTGMSVAAGDAQASSDALMVSINFFII
jgi:hypothetical protein